MTTPCRSHCRACNTCFSGDMAFDAHRTFAEGHKNDWAYRTCLDPIDDWRFAVKDRGGVCAVAGAVRRHPVRIWTLRSHLEKRADWAAVAKARAPR